MRKPIILIGPVCCGKSTIANLLSNKMNIPRYELDELRWEYYQEQGYDEEQASKIVREKGFPGLLAYWKPFEVYAVERVVSEYTNCVIDFGAGHSVFENEEQFNRVQKALSSVDHVILLLPSPDLDKSTKILNARFTKLLEDEIGEVDLDVLKMNENFVKHPSNSKLASATVYTEGKSPEETCEEIVQLISGE